MDGATITTADMPFLLDHYADKMSVLSLDCFDTLLWRNVAEPSDVFYDLQHGAAYQSLGVTAYQRIAAATRLRRTKNIASQNNQVTLQDIYSGFTALTPTEQQTLAAAEFQAEMNVCYAFPPIVALMRQAIQRNMKIIIVSDTFLLGEQLTRLLAQHVPADVFHAITHIFSSIDYGKFKAEGLFQDVLTKLAIPAQSILHVGDHPIADYQSAQKAGLHALHFLQFSAPIADFLRVQHASSSLKSLFYPSTQGRSQAKYSPFRGIFSALNLPALPPEKSIGYLSLGPILYAFAQLVTDEIKKLRQSSKRLKVLFLLRDAYLLKQAAEAYADESLGQLAHIRRSMTILASIRSQADIDFFLSNIKQEYFHIPAICDLLLLPPALAEQIRIQAHQSQAPQTVFYQLLHRADILALILENAAKMREKLKKYLLNEMHIQPGDTLLLVDIGYSGTTQTHLQRALQDELQIKIEGCYLVSSHEPQTPACTSLLTSIWCEHFLCKQLCACKSDILKDYDEAGKPLFNAVTRSETHYQKINAIQQECLQFIYDAKHFFAQSGTVLSNEILKATAASALFRHLFFPTAAEIVYLHDIQDDNQQPLYNLNRSIEHSKRGTNHGSHAYEARALSLDKHITTLIKRAYQVYYPPEENSYYHHILNVTAIKDVHHNSTPIAAIPTHDGFYTFTLAVPSGTNIGISFGEQYRWVQIEYIVSLEQPEKNLLHEPHRMMLNDIRKANTLFECQSNNASCIILANPNHQAMQHYQIVFRPIILQHKEGPNERYSHA